MTIDYNARVDATKQRRIELLNQAYRILVADDHAQRIDPEKVIELAKKLEEFVNR